MSISYEQENTDFTDKFGILGFVSNSSGFTGEIKNQWEDFHVHEVDLNGNILHLEELIQKEDVQKELNTKFEKMIGKDWFMNKDMFTDDFQEWMVKSGCFSYDDVSTIRTFLLYLKEIHENLMSIYPNGLEFVEDIYLKKNLENIISKDLFVIVYGNSVQCQQKIETKVMKIDCQNETHFDAEKKCYKKETRRFIHSFIQNTFPFLVSETLSLNELLTCTNCKNTRFKNLLPSVSSETDKVVVISVTNKCLEYIFLNKKLSQLAKKSKLCPYMNQDFDNVEQLSVTIPDIKSTEPLKKNRKKKKKKHESKEQTYSCYLSHTIQRIGNTSSIRWPKDRPDYLYFHMYKYNRDTAEAIQTLANCTYTSPKFFSFAGTKDRRAITVQAVTVYRMSIEKLKSAILHPKWDRNIFISNMRYVESNIELGSLKGNHFRVCIRNVNNLVSEELHKTIKDLKTKGFINFYGTQRFGARRIPTHLVGVEIIKKNYKNALSLIFDQQGFFSNNNKENKMESSVEVDQNLDLKSMHYTFAHTDQYNLINGSYQTFDINDPVNCVRSIVSIVLFIYTQDNNLIEHIFKSLPRHLYVEKQLLKYLFKNGPEYLQALQSLPKASLTLYLHAVQSLIWNYVASYRHKHYGLVPIVGDFVSIENSLNNDLGNIGHYDNLTECRFLNGAQSKKIIVLEDETQLKKFNSFDIILPLPGEDVQYPNYLLPVYEKYCNELFSLSLKDIKTAKGLPNLAGDYRHVYVRPCDVDYAFLSTNVDTKLLRSDIDVINEIKRKKNIMAYEIENILTSQNNLLFNITKQPDEIENNQTNLIVKTLLISCTLPKSSYITMACRELFKQPKFITQKD